MAKIKDITNAQATTVAAIAFADGMEAATAAIEQLGFTMEVVASKLAHMARVANKGSKSTKGPENAQTAKRIVEWLVNADAPRNSCDIMREFGLKSASKVSIVMREAVAEGIVIRGRDDDGRVNYRINKGK